MIKVELKPIDVELALDTANKRFIGNLKMGKGFSYGYKGDYRKQIADSFLGALAETSYAKAFNKYYNGSYSDNLERYTDSDFQNNIEIRAQEKKDYNFLLIRPGEKKGKYILVIHEGDFKFLILGWFPYTSDESMQHRLTNFGYAQRPPVYKVDIKELYNMNDL
jgi:hypothetical protein